MAKKDVKKTFKKVIDGVWPLTKKELEKGKKVVENVWPQTKKELDKAKEVVDRVWPKTRKELEKGRESAKVLLIKGEKYLRQFSKKGVEQTKKMSLSLKKEKLYHTLGKTISNIPATKWNASETLKKSIQEIKELEKQIKKIK